MTFNSYKLKFILGTGITRSRILTEPPGHDKKRHKFSHDALVLRTCQPPPPPPPETGRALVAPPTTTPITPRNLSKFQYFVWEKENRPKHQNGHCLAGGMLADPCAPKPAKANFAPHWPAAGHPIDRWSIVGRFWGRFDGAPFYAAQKRHHEKK